MSNNSSTIYIVIDRGLPNDNILLFNLIAWGYVGMVVSLFGIVGNIITLLVLLSPSMRRTSTNIYLTSLSCSNILYLLMVILYRSMISILEYMKNGPPSALHILLMRLPTTPIYLTTLLSVIYLTIAVSIDRLIFVKFPLEAKQILTQRTTRIVIVLIYIFSIVYCIPFWLEEQYHSGKQKCRLTNIGYKIYKYTRIYMLIPVVYLIPLITLTYINIAIIQTLIAKKRRKKNLGINTNIRNQADNYVIVMLVTATILFDLCRLPSLIIKARFMNEHDFESFNLLFLLHELGVLLFVFNISTSFIIHCFFGEKFREILIEFILHIIPNYNRQRNLERRLSENQIQQNLQSLEQKQIIPSDYSLTTMNDLKKSNDLNNTSNQNLVKNLATNQQELSPLIKNSEKISVINEKVSFKLGQNHNLHSCENGK